MAKKPQPTQPFIGTLTEADFEVLRWVVQDAKSRRINTQSKSHEQHDHQAPETYVGITLEEIPALKQSAHTGTGTGSGTGAEGDTAGKGNCRLIRIMKSDNTLDRLPNKVEAFNISGSSIPKNQEVLLARDKFGNWLVIVGGGGSIVSGRATTSVPAATNPLVGVGFRFRKFVVDNPVTIPKLLKEENVDTVAVNRWTLVSGDADSLVMCAYIDGEWRLLELQQVCP